METVEVTSESLAIRDLSNAEDILCCMKEAERKSEPQILFESDPRGLNLDSRCHFLRGADFDILERYFERNGREYQVEDPQGIPYRLYSVPEQRSEIYSERLQELTEKVDDVQEELRLLRLEGQK